MRRLLPLVAVAALVLLAVATGLSAARGPNPDAVPTAQQVEERTMSPFCVGLTLAACPSSEALQLRATIADMVAGGKTNRQIDSFLLANYPKTVIGAPRSPVAWLVPAAAVIAGLGGAGCRVIDVGLAPTPTIQLAVLHHGAGGGIAITASHNPIEWNALKFIGPDGIFLDGANSARVLDLAAREGRGTGEGGRVPPSFAIFPPASSSTMRHASMVRTSCGRPSAKPTWRARWRSSARRSAARGMGGLSIPPCTPVATPRSPLPWCSSCSQGADVG